jgi:predicted ribosomally synthesized peptide with nif11-like leader|tara:strand:+ start:348 stop:623 length:276 start_codon:yes stop_codon:yes gene_type:complete
MSKENLEWFIQKVTDSEELQARIGEEIDTESLIALGAECGCEFTAEELQESAELSGEELDAVAGGAGAGGTRFVVVPVASGPQTSEFPLRI